MIPPVIPKYRYLQCSRTLGTQGMPALKVTECFHCVPAQGMPDLKVTSDPPSNPQVLLFTVLPHLGHPFELPLILVWGRRRYNIKLRIYYNINRRLS